MSQSDFPPGLEETRSARDPSAPRATGGGASKKRAPRPSRDIKRKGMTPKLRAFLFQAQEGRCGCGCGAKIEANAIGEHFETVALGNKKRPDALFNRACAKLKTYGGTNGDKWRAVGGDIRDIKHTRKLEEKRTQHDVRNARGPKLRTKRKLQGAGFRKDVRRRMDGTTELVR